MALYFRDKKVLFEDEDIQVSHESSNNNSNSEIDTKYVLSKEVKITLDELEKKAQDSSMSMVAIAKLAWGLRDSSNNSDNVEDIPQGNGNPVVTTNAEKADNEVKKIISGV